MYKAIILNDVAVGQPHWTRNADTGRTSAPKGYDSVSDIIAVQPQPSDIIPPGLRTARLRT